MRVRSCAALHWIFCCIYAASAQLPDQLSPGIVVPKVVCSGDAQQSYALYLPSSYSPHKRWPIIYIFDPGARGQVAVETVRAAAEKYGYVVVGSNNSHNGSDASSTGAANALWQDTQQRFSIDERRRYFAGMSGGARVATALAMSCKGCVAGVIANAAGFPPGRSPSSALTFAYFAAVGNADFNFGEFVDLRPVLEESGMQYRIRVFEGQHGWAPPEVWLDALNWMDLQAMRSGAIPRDQDRIQQSYAAVIKQAEQFRSNKDPLAAFREARFAIHEFSGLTDTSTAEQLATDLAKDKRFKAAQKKEAAAVAEQHELMGDPSAQMNTLAQGNLSSGDFMALRDTIATLLKQVRKNQEAGDDITLIRRRALSGLVVQAFESGQFALDQKKYDVALRLFDLAASGSEAPGWGYFQRARVYAITADRKNMLRELKQAYDGGVHDPTALGREEFRPFQSDPEFQRVLQQWTARTTP